MQQKRKKGRPSWTIGLAVVVGVGLMVHVTRAQSVFVEEPWSFAEIVQADGQIRLPSPGAPTCTGWRLRLDPMLRARFVPSVNTGSPCPARTEGSSSMYWDDQLLLPGITGQVRAFRAGDEAVYVDSRFSFKQSGITVSGILRWEATTGRLHVMGNAPQVKPAITPTR